MFADAIALRTHLVTTLSSHLGEWEDGTARIHIVPPTPKLTGKLKATTTNGSELECTIYRLPEGEVTPSSGGQSYADQSFKVELVNFSDDTNLINAMTAVLRDADLVLERQHVYLPAAEQTYEQATFFVYAPKMINRVEVS